MYSHPTSFATRTRNLVPFAAAILTVCAALSSRAYAQAEIEDGYLRYVDTVKAGVSGDGSEAIFYSPRARGFLVLARSRTSRGESDLLRVTRSGVLAPLGTLPVSFEEPVNVTFDAFAQRLLILNPRAGSLVELRAGADGLPDGNTVSKTSIQHWGLEAPKGMAVDPDTGVLFVLDAARMSLVRVTPVGSESFDSAEAALVPISGSGHAELQGIAVEPASGHLHVMSPATREIWRVAADGHLVESFDLSGMARVQAECLMTAPSGDATDDPSITSLFAAASSSGDIVELSLSAPAALPANVAATLVQTIDTSLLSPPSPDPAGIGYNSSLDTLLMSDSEVNEMAIFAGVNLFELLRTGELNDGTNTLAFSAEPTGVAYDPITGHAFITDDDAAQVFEVDPGPDGRYGTADDIVSSFDSLAFGGTDLEGVAFDSFAGALFLVDGINSELFRVAPGPNGVFDGVAPVGDDVVTQFDTQAFGISDPEGIAFDSTNGHLYVVGLPLDTVAEISTDGTLLRSIDVSVVNAVNPAGLAFAPGSVDPLTNSLYVTDRGIDNDADPNENDGKIYEVFFPPITSGNVAPMVDAGPDQTLTLPDVAALDGTVSDDGLPTGAVTSSWSQVSGEGTVTFADPASVDTTASFSIAGTYVLRLTASDGELSANDEMTVTVSGDSGVTVLDTQVAASSDDAEERFGTNQGVTTSPDLELVFDGGAGQPGNQTVGIRFADLNIPQGSTITNAFVQFQADSVTSEPTVLNVQGEASDNAATFDPFLFAVTSRPRTAAAVGWSPEPWLQPGEAQAAQRTTNIAPIIEEIVGRDQWVSGNALAIIIDGTGQRIAESFDGLPAGAPRLHVEFIPGAPGNQAPSVDAGPDQFVMLPANAVLDGTVTDDGLPDPPGAVTTLWEQVSGEGTVVFDDPSAVDTVASFGIPGTYVLRLSADDGFQSSSDELTVTVSGDAGVTVVESRVAASSDDAEERFGTNQGVTTSPDLELVFDGGAGQPGDQTVGMRFVGLAIPDGAIITNAFVQFQTDAPTSEVTTLNVQGEAADDAATFNPFKFAVTSRPRTLASVPWSPPPWLQAGDAGVVQRTPDISPVVQEIVDRELWVSGNAIVVIIDGTGQRIAESFDGLPEGAPLLHVEYSLTPPNTSPLVTIVAPSSGTTVEQGQSVAFAGSASDLEDGDLTASLAWSSSLDGPIGTGGSFLFAGLSVGQHVVTATATDSGGLSGDDSIVLTVSPPNAPPSVSISSPADGSSFGQGASVTFAGSALDAEEGDVSASLAWSSDLDGAIGSGGSFSSSTLSVGTHTVTASVTDSGGLTGQAQVTVTITPDFVASFDAGPDGFVYLDDAFRGTSAPDYADGSFVPAGGFDGGGLSVDLGGIDDADIPGMSGGWRRGFTLPSSQSVTVRLRYNLTQAANYESNELSEALLSVDGTLYGVSPDDFLAQIAGNGNGGEAQTTGWVQVTVSVGNLSAGAHTLTVGGFNNLKTFADETTNVLIDDVELIVAPPINFPPEVVITSPADGSSFAAGTPVTFTGEATDPEDGDLSSGIMWTSSLDGDLGTGASITVTLSNGAHVIGAVVTDSGGQGDLDSINVTMVPNAPPSVSISSPADGSSFGQGASVTFAGSALDAEEGDVSASLAWSSDLDGAIGSGGSFSSSTLSVGTHTVTASVTDSGGLTGQAQVTVTITPDFVASFDAGPDGFVYLDDAFRGTSAPDYADGSFVPAGGFDGGGLSVDLGGIDDADIPGMSGGWRRGFTLPSSQSVTVRLRYNLTQAANYESNELSEALLSVDGTLYGVSPDDFLAQIAGNGNGGEAQTTGWVQVTVSVGNLSAGAHTLTVGGFNNLKTFADETTNVLIDDVELIVAPPINFPPEVVITSPADGSSFAAGTPVTFTGEATDPEDGDLSSGIMWTSSLDGVLGAGASITVTLSPGTHTVDAFSTDSGGASGSDRIGVKVAPPNTAPVVTITAPPDGASFTAGQSVAFAGGAIDLEEGDLSASLAWVSDVDGPIGSGAGFSTAALSEGLHTVTASVVDSGGLGGQDQVVLTITPGPSGAFDATFDDGPDGFGYVDDAFRGTSAPAYASGSFVPGGGFAGGGLRVQLGGIDNADIQGMSGGWRRTFTLAGTRSVLVRLRFNLTQAANYESNEISESLLSIDGTLIGIAPNDYLARWVGNGNGGSAQSTGWVEAILDAGDLGPGEHTLTIGAFNNLKTLADETTEVLVDDVSVIVGPQGNTPPVVAIDAPAQGAVFQQGQSASFSGSATDVPDGDLSASLVWTSSRDGAIGFGSSFSTSQLSLGVHVVTATVSDSAGFPGSAAIKLAVTGPGGLAVLDRRVATGDDDVEERASGNMYMDSSDLELVTDGSAQSVGIRFDSLPIPAGSSIFKAYIQFQTDETNSGATSLIVRGEASNDAAPFEDVTGNLSGRATTTGAVSWTPAPWTTVGEQGPDQRTPDLADVLQEIVGRPGWQSGNAASFVIVGNGERTAEAYDGVAAAAPKLHVEYVVDPSVAQPVNVVAQASKDAYVEEDSEDHNHGDEDDIVVRPETGERHHGLIAFDLSAVPAGTVSSATLRLWEDNTRDDQLIHVHRLTSDWDEDEVTWEDRDDDTSWTTEGGDFVSTPIASFAPNVDDAYREIDVTDVVADWLSSGGNFGFLLRSTTTDEDGDVKFKSRDEDDEDERPQLVITVTPQ